MKGEIIIVDADAPLESGSFVLVKNGKGEVIFKQAKRYGDIWVLRPLNPKYPEIEMTEEHQYIGRVIRKIKRRGLKRPYGRFLHICLLLFIIVKPAIGADYWTCIQTIANKRFKHDWQVTLTVGYEEKAYYDQVHRGPYGDITLTIPLYSSQKRRQLQEDRKQFLEHWAGIIKQLEASEEELKILKQQAKAARAVMGDGGIEAINAYFEIVKQIALVKAQIRQYRRVLDAVCGYGNTQ